MPSEIQDRRQRAREEYYDVGGAPDARGEYAPIEMSIQVATRVQLTPEMIQILANGGASDRQDLHDIFTLAGFEVVD